MTKQFSNTISALALGTIVFLTGMEDASATGFQLFEQNVSSLGYAYAGTAASVEDASTAFYNPAGLTLLPYPEVIVSAVAIDLNIDAMVKSATANPLVGLRFGIPPQEVHGHGDVYPGAWSIIPAIHLAFPRYHCLGFGLSVTSPYGLLTAYPGDSQVKYLATLSKLQVVDISPTIAIQLNPNFSIGGGVNMQYAKAQLNQKVPIGESLPSAFGGPFPDGDFRNQARDHRLRYGWNLGMLYEYCHIRLGLDYRSRVRHHFEGNANLNLPRPLVSANGKVSASVTLPDTANFSFYQDINCHWAVLGSVNYTHWKLVDKVVLNFSGPITDNIETVSLAINFKDAYRYALGANFQPCPRWKLKGGLAYDETPVRSDQDRTLRIPDNNRYWVGFGVAYEINRCFVLDVGYTHLFVRHFTADQTQETTLANGGVLFTNVLSDFDSSVNEIGLQLTWKIT